MGAFARTASRGRAIKRRRWNSPGVLIFAPIPRNCLEAEGGRGNYNNARGDESDNTGCETRLRVLDELPYPTLPIVFGYLELRHVSKKHTRKCCPLARILGNKIWLVMVLLLLLSKLCDELFSKAVFHILLWI